MSIGVRLMHRGNEQLSSGFGAFMSHRARYLFAFLVLLLMGAAPLAQAATFEFETAILTTEATQTVSGVTMTASFDAGSTLVLDFGSAGGTTGNVLTDDNVFDTHQTLTFAFDAKIDLTSLVLADRGTGTTFKFTPIGGSNSTVQATASSGGQTVSLNWTGVTGFTVTELNDNSWADIVIDNLVFSDPYAPVLSSTGVSATTSSGTTLSSTSDQLAIAYWVVLAGTGATPPSAAQVKAGNDSTDTAAVASGNAPMVPGGPTDIPITGLSASTAYTACIMAEDGIPNLSSVSCVNVTTTAATSPAITSATYDASTGALVVTGTNIEANGGGVDIDASMFTLTGEGGATYTLTDTADVEIDSATQFTLMLSATDKAAVNQILNKDGTTSTGGTTYNLAAADDWDTNVTSGDTSDATGNAITVSNVAAPTITSATYDASTGSLGVTGTGLLKLSGATNDIVANKFTFTGQGGGTYTLTDTSNVEITSGTQFTLTLSSTDKAGVNAILNKNGTSSVDATTYNLAAAEDWAAGADAAVTVADATGNGITVSNAASATTYTVTYNGNGNTGGSAPTDGSSPYASGTTVTVLGNTGSLVKTGYTFAGWNTAADGSGTDRTASATFPIVANTTLYAKWEPTLSACAATPTLPGCSTVLPSLAVCITAPTTAGCSVVLPTLTACVVTPSLPGCSVVLPSLAACTATPTLAGCSVVLPAVITGACGSALNTGPLTSAPTTNLCAAGTYLASPGDTAAKYNWSCEGSNGGTTAVCFANRGYTVTPSAGANVSLSPGTPQLLASGGKTTFTVTPASGYVADSVGGCAGTLGADGKTFTTGLISQNCTVTASAVANTSAKVTATATGDITSQTIVATVTPAGKDSSKLGTLYVAAVLPASVGGGVFLKNSSGSWVAYDPANPAYYQSPVTLGTGPISLDVASASDLSGLVGTKIYVGYGRGTVELDGVAAPWNSMLSNGTYILAYTIESGGGTTGGTAAACGSANSSTPVTSAPAQNLCAAGTASAITTADGKYTWSCQSSTGTAAQCSATRGYVVTPSAAANVSLNPGTSQTVAYNATTSFKVAAASGYALGSDSVTGCNGTFDLDGNTFTTGPITADCEVKGTSKVIAAACGSANSSTPMTSAPAQNLCAAGTASPVATNADSYTWSCASADDASNATCAASRGYVVTLTGEHVGFDPGSPLTVAHGKTTGVTVTPASGYSLRSDSVKGCGGTLDLNSKTFTTGAIIEDCTVTASAASSSEYHATQSGSLDSATLVGTLNASSADVGKQGAIYVAFVYQGQVYFMDSNQTWTTYGGTSPTPYFSGTLPATRTIDVLKAATDLSSLKGGQLYLGYGFGPGNPFDEMLNAGRYSIVYTVQ